MTAGESTASPPSPEALHGDLESLWQQLQRIRERAEALEARFEPELQQVHPNFAASARNLLHYFALRQYDIGELQERLSELGLSSLGRAEHHVLASIHAVQHALLRLCSDDAADSDAGHLPFPPGEKRLQLHARALLGEPPAERAVPIMVTLPTAAADDYDYVRGLMSAGMDLARINCAHDTQEAWLGMIRNVRMASDKLGRPCRIMMDLGGPKFRTGQLQPGPKVSRLRPRRDALGQVLAPRRVRCVPDDEPWTGTKSAVVPVPRRSIELAEIGDLLRFKDTRGRRRKLEVVLKDNKGLVLELYKTAYIGTDLSFRLVSRTTGEELEFRFGELPPVEQPIMLHVGDPLILTRDGAPGAPAVLDKDDRVTTPARVSCRPVEIFEQVAINDPVSLDDGRIEGIVEEVSGDEILVRITSAKPTGSRLRSNKGINFPGTDLDLEGITVRDREDLAFVVEHADVVALSFVRRPEDVIALQEELRKYPGRDVPIVAKIETRRAFSALPQILLAVMRRYPAGLMIARGDLAIECGWVRLAEIQEEMLWICEAAHVPVIWATQVLEGAAKKGTPTRAEITDAAMSQRADCVMLNKGPNILGAIHTLDKILRKMQRHHDKKTARLVRLSISDI
ncbi:MAG: pyruvate kinase [Gammaproteobacteria bacterium]|nr:pyruvate kinase [Gammaproteobacteria bacterium]MDH3863481.1 pyruvate kinase [Gammaproteobacteria bacterium]MDH3906250.1 pyruvate kinase [Gammaproteobacteria bacterium]